MNIISKLKSKVDAFFVNPEVRQSISKTNWGSKVLIVSVSLTAIVLGIRTLGGLQAWELGAFDILVNMRADEKEDPRLLVVGYTEEDIEKLNSDQISDGKLAEVLRKLQQYEPKIIGIDIFRDIPIGEGYKDLEEVFKNSNNIVAPCEMSDGKDNRGIRPPSYFLQQEELQAAVGFVNVLPDVQDGVLRRGLLISSPPENQAIKNPHLCSNPQSQLFSLPFLLATSYFPENVELKEPEQDEKTKEYTKYLQIGKAIFKPIESNAGGYQNLSTSDYQILLNYRSRGKASKEVSISDILNNKVSSQDIKDKIVLVGYTALSKKDNFPTPYQKIAIMPGVHIHAQLVSQMISAVEDGRPAQILYFPEKGEWLWIWGWSIVGGLLTYRKIKSSLVVISVLVTAGGLFLICYGGLTLFTYWLPLVPSVIVFLGTSAIVFSLERIEPKEVDWDLIREEENKKKEQAEKKNRQEFLKQLEEKAKELESQLNNEIPEIQDSPNHLQPPFNKNNWLELLWKKAQQIQESWEDTNVNPVEQKKASVRKLIKECQDLRNRIG